MMKKVFLLSGFLFGMAWSCFATLELPAIFSDGLVIQQKQDFVVWGWSDRSDTVTLQASWLPDAVKAERVGKDGKWKASIPAPQVGGPYELKISDGDDVRNLKDLLCGEVWLCSGQSNMDFGLKMDKNGKEEIKKANIPDIRLFHIPRKSSLKPEKDVDAKWTHCTPETVQSGVWNGFSAVGYYFAKSLHEKLGVPVGVIKSAYGGSCIETWTPDFAYKDDLVLRNIYREKLKSAASADSDHPEKNGRYYVTGLYNAMIAPIVPYSIRGVLWYQGEHNIHWNDGAIYRNKMEALVSGWRSVFENPEMPFYYVQIAPYKKYLGELVAPQLCEAQRRFMTFPKVGMVVTSDVGNLDDIHPKDKKPVADRLVRWAMAKTYGETNLVCSGPIYKSMKVDGDKVVVFFDYVGSGLTTRDGKAPSWFELAGSDEQYFPAVGKIVGDTVEVRCKKVKKPQFVRMGWNEAAQPNLCNKEGLPASLFTSDDSQFVLPTGENLAYKKEVICARPNRYKWSPSHLVDGKWSPKQTYCFATDREDIFPKSVAVDLGEVKKIHAVRFGVPYFGSTKTVSVSVSTNGVDFEGVGISNFKQGFVQRSVLQFDPMDARYVRLTFLNRYDHKEGYTVGYQFVTELEVYSAP